MISNIKNHGNEMKQMILEDRYKARGWRDGSLDYVFDVGANIGMFSVSMRMRHPNARIIAVEPCPEALVFLPMEIKRLLPFEIMKVEALGYVV